MSIKGVIRWFFVSILPPVLAVLAAVWAIRDVPPVEMRSMRFVGPWLENKPGTEFTIHLEGMKNRVCPVVVKEELIDSQGEPHVLPLRIGVIETVGEFSSDVQYRLPREPIPDGITVFHSTAVYSPDPLNFCFKTWTISSPQRPDVRFWLGHGPPPWAMNRNPR